VVQGDVRPLPGKPKVGAGQLDQLGAGDVLGQEAAVLSERYGKPVRCSSSVGAWISGRNGRASISNVTRRRACAALGLAVLRISLANQRRKRSSWARLGTSMATAASVPQSWSNWSRAASKASGGIPIG
jgi:hypothetical protein